MKVENGQFWFFASDLMRFQGCMHTTTLDLRKLEFGDISAAEDSEETQLLQDHGHAHEAQFTRDLIAAGRQVTAIETKNASPQVAFDATRAAMERGDEIITQATLRKDQWGGYADFLYRVDHPSTLGNFSYEVADTKLSRKPKPYQILQLCLYSDLVADVQGVAPERAHLELGDGETYTVRLSEVSAYARQAKAHFEGFVAERPTTRPEPTPNCSLCRWREHCSAESERTDSLVQVAGITKSQRRKIEAVGIKTMAGLAARKQHIPKLVSKTQDKLVTHARLQTQRKNGGKPSFELRPEEPGRGFHLLPRPHEGDLFYDIEGDPYYEDGLEYLHGVWFYEQGEWIFRNFWAHDRQAEGKTVGLLLDFFAECLKAYPDAHIYHYAAYEISALRRLTALHRTREAIFDQLLREQRFVDLYAVVSGALLASEGGYSIKNLEVFYLDERKGDLTSGGASIVAYEKWRQTGDDTILHEILDYNEIDCVSTQKLRDWLIDEVRPAEFPWPVDRSNPGELNTKRVDADEAEVEALRLRVEPLRADLGTDTAALLVDLNSFYARADKPAWWAVFDRLTRDRDELFDDLECLAGLEAIGDTLLNKGGTRSRHYRFPIQETKLHTSSTACMKPAAKPIPVTIIDLNLLDETIEVKFPRKVEDPPAELDLIPAQPFDNKILRGAIDRMTTNLVGKDTDARAVRQFLMRGRPTFLRHGRDAQILPKTADMPAEISKAIADLDHAALAIQGPPGTGKTYVSARSIVDLVRAGKRVAVSSNSHKAIENLLITIAKRAESEDVPCAIVHKVSDKDTVSPHSSISHVTGNDSANIYTADVVGGTAWHFARYEKPAFKYLFVDEAGQVSIANIVAMAGAAENIVLVGDPMQLPQPVQGSHPGDSGKSSLEYLLAGHRVVPSDRGIFLPVSRRLHSNVCKFISQAVYEGKLNNDEEAASQTLVDHLGRELTGAHFVAVEHNGRSQSAPEEVDAIKAAIDALLGSRYRDRDGRKREIGLRDFLVVAPYNAQANTLRAALPEAIRIGTVDKFQGQEAPICLVSMTTSSADELPRDIDFLFSLNRINVAVSRAQALALVFASPRLLDVPCRTVEQMMLVNTLCQLREHGHALELEGVTGIGALGKPI